MAVKSFPRSRTSDDTTGDRGDPRSAVEVAAEVSGHLLLVGPGGVDRDVLLDGLDDLGWRSIAATETPDAGELMLAAQRDDRPFDAVVLDVEVDDPRAAAERLRALLACQPKARFVVLVPSGAVQTAVAVAQLGAVACFEKPVDAARIVGKLGRRRSRLGLPSLDWVVWNHVQRVLGACGGNKSEAARILGVTRRGLHNMLQKAPPARPPGQTDRLEDPTPASAAVSEEPSTIGPDRLSTARSRH